MSATELLAAAQQLAKTVDTLRFNDPVAMVYNPLVYAWAGHAAYIERYGQNPRPVVFLGMNPGPFGMVQTGVPFGEVNLVRDWMGIDVAIDQPAQSHPKRPIEGFQCMRSEVSGRRLWGTAAAAFGSPERFFATSYVANYCPLAFVEAGGRNLTPDKLPAAERAPLYAACDDHLRQLVTSLQAQWVIGVGGFAEARARLALAGLPIHIGRILHPSPASPAANRDWSGKVTTELRALGLCDVLAPL
ncbi:MAG: single-stranded DNA-binding protein [Candidatus Sericytochromatia bacterium]|nr:single-stranded DNA-binding protein [Candidatus Sericytochromatia bacterium]